MPDFEVAVYNKEVRECVEGGERHRDLSDDWADIHYFEIVADNEAEARARIARKYPPHQGYVIESVEQSKY